MLGKAPVTIYRMVRKGEIKAYKNGKELFFFEDEVEHMIKAGKII
jgi:excisionase family DNA binding protein